MDKKTITKIKNFLLDLFFPKFCLGCKKEGIYLCQDCKEILEISEYNYCLCDKNPFRLPPSPPHQTKFWCGGKQSGKCQRCQDKKLSGLYFALPYKERRLTRELILQFKYKPYVKDLAKTLALLIIEHLVLAGKNKEEIWQNSILTPVPLDKKKLRDRNYNQAEELTKELSKIIKVPVISDNLIKIKATLSQVELTAEKRKENLKGVFAVKNPKEILGKKIFLVDDVYTTGSTMEECAKILKEAGAKSVWGIVIAREG